MRVSAYWFRFQVILFYWPFVVNHTLRLKMEIDAFNYTIDILRVCVSLSIGLRRFISLELILFFHLNFTGRQCFGTSKIISLNFSSFSKYGEIHQIPRNRHQIIPWETLTIKSLKFQFRAFSRTSMNRPPHMNQRKYRGKKKSLGSSVMGSHC